MLRAACGVVPGGIVFALFLEEILRIINTNGITWIAVLFGLAAVGPFIVRSHHAPVFPFLVPDDDAPGFVVVSSPAAVVSRSSQTVSRSAVAVFWTSQSPAPLMRRHFPTPLPLRRAGG